MIRPRTEAEQDAYMEGQLNALRLAERKGVEYARNIIEHSQRMIRECRGECPRQDSNLRPDA